MHFQRISFINHFKIAHTLFQVKFAIFCLMKMSCNVRMLLTFNFVRSLFSCITINLILCGGTQALPKAILKDYFVGDTLELRCAHRTPYKRGSKVTWSFTRHHAKRDDYKYQIVTAKTKEQRSRKKYGHASFVKQFTPNDPADERADVEYDSKASVLHMAPLLTKDSGRFDCVKATGSCSWKINVHDPTEMVYVITSRGQKPWEDTVASRYRVILKWSDWTECDGCAGNGERRKFGFCYVMWLDKKAHCLDTKELPVLMRTIALRRREEIIVDICYDHCQEYDEPIVVEEQRVDVSNGADASLICDENAFIDTAIRWERAGEVLKRSDVSFGYGKTQPLYVSKRNDLLLHNIDLPRGGIIDISCVEERERRIRFDLYVQAHPDIDQATVQDHLFWVGISSTIQIVAFLLILVVYITIENFVEAFKKRAGGQLEEEDEEDSEEEDSDEEEADEEYSEDAFV